MTFRARQTLRIARSDGPCSYTAGYWHSHDGCARAAVPSKNRNYWLAKFVANRELDRDALAKLSSLGFRSLAIWECELWD